MLDDLAFEEDRQSTGIVRAKYWETIFHIVTYAYLLKSEAEKN